MIKKAFKKLIVGTFLETPVRKLIRRPAGLTFTSSDQYWDERYRRGGNSGAGSYGRLAQFKAEVLNDFVAENGVNTVVEFGSGDGNQLNLARYPSYLGVDVSKAAVEACSSLFAVDPDKNFVVLEEYDGQIFDLSLSLDVIYHLVEDGVYETYMHTLFESSRRFVIIYASNYDKQPKDLHVRHRKFTDWVKAKQPAFRMIDHIPNNYPFDPKKPNETSFADFFIFELKNNEPF
jgi:hypothetical protein